MRRSFVALAAVALAATPKVGVLAPPTVSAQTTPAQWVGVGAIGQTAMFMDTTSIERDGAMRRVWMESIDPVPTTFVVGSDTTRFDTVVAFHVFDCRAHTHAIETARYYLAGVAVAPPRPADVTPERLRPGSFMQAVFDDLCSR